MQIARRFNSADREFAFVERPAYRDVLLALLATAAIAFLTVIGAGVAGF